MAADSFIIKLYNNRVSDNALISSSSGDKSGDKSRPFRSRMYVRSADKVLGVCQYDGDP